MYARVVLLVAVLALAQVVLSDPAYYTCFKLPNGNFTVQQVQNASGVAVAKYDQEAMQTTGWAFLSITSNNKYADADQMYAAGFLEGAIAKDLIYAFFQNIVADEYNGTSMTPEVASWIESNANFMSQQVKANPTDPYWAHIGLILTQLNGIVDGYNAYTTNSSMKLTFLDFMLINMDGDMSDLEAALNATFLDWSDDQAVIRRYILNSHCSSVVKLADDVSDIFAGHTTWEGFSEMVRIFKIYNLPISVSQSSNVVMFSGYPGSLSSVDDFYQTDTKLVVMETTNGVMNRSLYNAVTPESVLSFIRVIVSNKMASNGQEWTEIFGKLNSGTYNNQWIVVDMNKLVPGSHVEPGALWILEQIPGYVESADVTDILSYGYWPSYNVPYFPYIYNISGFPEYAKKYGSFFTYENNPRAEIFRRDANKIHDIAGIRKLLRYNDYKNDKLSHGNPAYAISSRFDLEPNNKSANPMFARMAFGGVDSKATSAKWVNNMACSIEGGPSHDNVPPFVWSAEWETVSHVGLPQTWDFSWVDVYYSPEDGYITQAP